MVADCCCITRIVSQPSDSGPAQLLQFKLDQQTKIIIIHSSVLLCLLVILFLINLVIKKYKLTASDDPYETSIAPRIFGKINIFILRKNCYIHLQEKVFFDF